MKKKIIIIGILLVIGLILGYYFISKNNDKVNSDAIRFKKEYEALNDELNDDGSKKYTKMSIDENNKIVYLDYEELIDFINNGTGTLYIGRPGCPWCRLLIEPMFEFAEENNVNIYYYNIEKDRTENNDRYKNVLKLLDEYLPIDTVTQNEDDKDFDKTLKRVVLPHVFFIDGGEIQNEILLYQHEFLKNNEKEKMKDLLDIKSKSYCDTSC